MKSYLSYLLVRIERWVAEHVPYACSSCGKLGLTSNAKTLTTTWGQRVYVCPKCHDAIHTT